MTLKRKYSSPQPNHPRVHKVTFMLNDDEQKAVERYLARYKIMEEDYPTLFNENEMRR